MFVGAINATVRKFLGNIAPVFDGRVVVVGCSGNCTSEAVISQYAQPAAIHSNDVSFYSCMLGRWLTGKPLDFEIVDPSFGWLEPFLDEDIYRMASIMLLLDALPFEKQNNAHRVRMWNHYLDEWPQLVEWTAERLGKLNMRIDSFYEGDVLEHFERFADVPNAVFCCYAPTYSGGYERLYKRLDEIVRWDEPVYSMLDDEARDRLLCWMAGRSFLWYDDRVLPGYEPVMQQRSGRKRPLYLYSNVVESPAVFDDRQPGALPNLPLANGKTEISPGSRVWLQRIKTTELVRFKDAFMNKGIEYAEGMWAFAVVVGGKVVGFLEFARDNFEHTRVYMLADFAVPGTRYRRLSKLIVMLARAGETRAVLERARQLRTLSLVTTAFTDKPVSMKYRGVLDLVKRGATEDGKKFLNYGAGFDGRNWQEVLGEWLDKHSSVTS